MNTKLIAAIALVGALGAGGWWYSTQTNGPAPMEAAAQVGTTEVHPLDMVLGNREAPVVMVEYSSLTCPHCAAYNAGARSSRSKKISLKPGKYCIIKREVYFDRYGLWAAMVARCGGEARYHGMLELIYQTQSTWAASSDPMQVANNLRRLGRQAGMNDGANQRLP
jgi:protein-disulfide isomerase